MKYAICILAHNQPELLSKLVKRVSYRNTEVFVHLDARCNLAEYSSVVKARFLEKRIRVHWGGPSMVRAMLLLMQEAVYRSDCDYLIFISGQDFPVINPLGYDRFIDGTKNYVQAEKLPRSCWHEGGLDRIRYYYPLPSPQSLLTQALVKVQKIFRVGRDPEKLPFEIYGGSQWININRMTATYILLSWKPYYCFFKTVRIPDEMFFQTLLMNSPLKETVINHHFRYIIHREGELHPVNLNPEQWDGIRASGALFCRKIADVKAFEKFEEIMDGDLVEDEESIVYDRFTGQRWG